jgi:hypothetical protein
VVVTSQPETEIISLGTDRLPPQQSDEEPLGPIELHYFQAILGANFVLHAIEVVLHSLFGKRKMIGNFLIGEPLRDQGNDL